jgi:hypothetical protein
VQQESPFWVCHFPSFVLLLSSFVGFLPRHLFGRSLVVPSVKRSFGKSLVVSH